MNHMVEINVDGRFAANVDKFSINSYIQSYHKLFPKSEISIGNGKQQRDVIFFEEQGKFIIS